MDQQTLQFGLEIELLLGSRKKTYPNWKTLAKDVSKRLLKAGIPNHINDTNDKSPANYTEWSIAPEITIPNQPAKNLWGIELVSPVYHAHSYWASTISTIFSVLAQNFAIHHCPHTSTHIHVSGAPSPLSPEGLASLAKAALYYESALDALMPAGRRDSVAYWCQSNRASRAIINTGLLDSLAVLDTAQSTREVVETMNLFPCASAYGKANGKKKDFVRGKVYKWDFTGMIGERGTVEYRQPAGSLSAEDAAGWVTLALAFVAGAVEVGETLGNGRGEGASLDELWAMLVVGAEALGWEGLGAVEGLFERAE
ncbi:hypothetical protein OQA88_5314 [Cercophora sp. LCS_1]